ncbi:iron-containing alcohol dehydrogenase [Modestobacter sp. VKM Ac-2985]|uniref:iron-containing alcohol dehydrogenase n=1 Tax=Modestobacter sp. VKM Ac-2985 TaxID=3004139 RepID=UPI0022ABAD42|nr:iron-containing alcohol dehydrogenase [Modestobacter sp. VKM Ac-2985]MCZ2839962.1 iron-containing alcohol dehydrogenase [Modestobacter sp. VKM Ac-2985]
MPDRSAGQKDPVLLDPRELGASLGTGPEQIGTLRLPARVHVGWGARAQLPEVVGLHGRRVLAVVDPFLVGTEVLTGIVDQLARTGMEVQVYADITPELPVDTLTAAAEVARDFGADVVLAIGGGSALDAAKVVALLSRYGGPLSRYYGENLVPGPVVPIVAVPTTAGTGSEVTPVAVVSDPDRELKVGISSPFLVPAAAVVDPELTLGAPASVTAFSGIDALVHAVESYTARELDVDWSAPQPVFTGRNALIEPIALQAAGHLGPWLPVAVREPGNRRARSEVARGALLGGIAFGSTGTHLCHALQYPIGALTKTPHGLGTGLMLPYVLDVLRRDADVAARIATLGAALEGIPAADASAERTVARVVALNAEIGVPADLAAIGLDRDQLPHIADLALRSARLLAIAPIDPTRDLLLEVLEHALTGTRTDRSDA